MCLQSHFTINSSPILYPTGSSRRADSNHLRRIAKKPAIGSFTEVRGQASNVLTRELSQRNTPQFLSAVPPRYVSTANRKVGIRVT